MPISEFFLTERKNCSLLLQGKFNWLKTKWRKGHSFQLYHLTYMTEILAQYWQIILLFFLIALLYSSVGFGGGSSYLAILTLYDLKFGFLRVVSLLCNIVVVSNGSFQFFRKGFLDFKKMIPLVLASVPMAFLGGKMPIKEQTFFIILGITLLIAAITLWFQGTIPKISTIQKTDKLWVNLTIGGFIGLISGLVGIGGGIFLSPLLYFLKWDEPKKIAATASFFILVNSIAGLLGQMNASFFEMNWLLVFFLMASVAVGGLIGSYLGTQKLSSTIIRKATAVLIGYVSYTILSKYL